MDREGSVFEGKTLDDAVRKGLEALGLSRAEVMITMLEEGSGGFLGIGARPYRVRIMPRPGGPPREPVEPGRRERRGRRDFGGRPEHRGRPARAQSGAPERGPGRSGAEPRRSRDRGIRGGGFPQGAEPGPDCGRCEVR